MSWPRRRAGPKPDRARAAVWRRPIRDLSKATSLAVGREICHTLPPLAKPQAEIPSVFARVMFLIGRLGCLAIVLGPLTGCAMWDVEKWDPARYRDERAADIDGRLSSSEPIVNNPF